MQAEHSAVRGETMASSVYACSTACVQQALRSAQTEAAQFAAEAARAEAEKAQLMHHLLQSDTNGVKMADALELASKEVERALAEAAAASHKHLLSAMEQARSDLRVATTEQGRLSARASAMEAAMRQASKDLEATCADRDELLSRCEEVEAALQGTRMATACCLTRCPDFKTAPTRAHAQLSFRHSSSRRLLC